MSTKITIAYSAPVLWPAGTPRAAKRTWGPFKVTTTAVIYDLEAELKRLGATNIAITTSAPTLRTGRPDHSVLDRKVPDPGAVIYCRRAGRDLVFALDRYERPRDNLRGLSMTFEAIRAIERYGGPGLEDRALSGFAALPATAGASSLSWWSVLGIGEATYNAVAHPTAGASPANRARLLALAEQCYRERARIAHPDHGGTDAAMVELNAAIAAARTELR